MKKLLILTLGMMGLTAAAQETLTPDLLWKLGRLSPIGISKDGKNIVYKVATPSIEENKSNAKYYTIPVNGGVATEVPDVKDLVADKNLSPDGKYILSHKEVKVSRVLGKDFYPELKK
ncbi:MAG TPA: S9 family peptidase, partial [Flavobacterium sp.]|nr:S9 family peptidase [Flavobacterium sp.]